MSERTRAADDAGEGLGVRAAVDQGCVVGNIPSVASGSKPTSRSDLDRAGADGGGAAVGIVAAERECAGGVLSEHAGAADDARERLSIGAAVDQGGIVGNIPSVASGSKPASWSDLKCAGVDGRCAVVGVATIQHPSANPTLHQGGKIA